MARKHYKTGAELIASIKSPKAKTAKHTPFNEPWKKAPVKAKVTRKRGAGGSVPMPRQGTLSHYF